jgi:hypothetical protein
VLSGRVSPTASSGKAAGSIGSPGVSDPTHHLWVTSSIGATFPRSSKVELLATGRPGVRFRLSWQETCGGNTVGKHGVSGGSGGQAQLTLDTPASVLVKLPAAVGTYEGCYLAATVLMHTKTWHDAVTTAPHVRIVHH